MKLARAIAAIAAVATFAFGPHAEASRLDPTVGMEQVAAPLADASAIPLTIFYPSTSLALPRSQGPYDLDIALNGAPVKGRLPLIVLSHGTGGSALDSVNLALALARAGFVVAALEHNGDNFRDRSRSFDRTNFVARTGQVRAAIDFLLGTWHHRDSIDPTRIGMYGHSAGGTTALIIGGGVLDWSQVVGYCIDRPQEWACRNGRPQNATALRTVTETIPIAGADPRVLALAVAAPALSPGFRPSGLAAMKLPLQIWVAGKDAIIPDAAMVSDLLRTKHERHEIAGAGHFSFLAPCSDRLRKSAPTICAEPAGFARELFQRDFTEAVVRFFHTNLRGRPGGRH